MTSDEPTATNEAANGSGPQPEEESPDSEPLDFEEETCEPQAFTALGKAYRDLGFTNLGQEPDAGSSMTDLLLYGLAGPGNDPAMSIIRQVASDLEAIGNTDAGCFSELFHGLSRRLRTAIMLHYRVQKVIAPVEDGEQ